MLGKAYLLSSNKGNCFFITLFLLLLTINKN